MISTAALAAPASPVLLVVPPGSEMARVEAARASVPGSRLLLVVGASARIPLKEGVDLVADRSFADAPDSDLVVVLPGSAPGAEEFLSARKRTARAILFLGDSPLVERLKADPARGALILLGGPGAIPTLTGEQASAAAPLLSPTVPAPAAGPASPTAPRATPTAESAVRRYFSGRRPTATPTPRAQR